MKSRPRSQINNAWPRRSRVPVARNAGGRHACDIAEIAVAGKINESYVGRVLRLTLLAPDLVERILGGWQPAYMTLAVLVRPFAPLWTVQRETSHGKDDLQYRRLTSGERLPTCAEHFYERTSNVRQFGTCALIKALNKRPWLGTRRCNSSWAMTKSWNPTS